MYTDTIKKLASIVNEYPNQNVFSIAKKPLFVNISDEEFLQLNRLLRDCNMTLIENETEYLLVVLDYLSSQAKVHSYDVDFTGVNTHVDEFVDMHFNEHNYARFFFLLHRLSAALQCDFEPWISQYKLFCTFENKEYRVTGASRMGDVWLASDFNRDCGYDKRVCVDECSAWSSSPTGKEQEKELARIDALDLYSRLLCGQVHEIGSMYRFGKFGFPNRINSDRVEELDRLLMELKSIMFPELSDTASYSILDTENVYSRARLAYEELCTLRANRADYSKKSKEKRK